MEEEKKNKPAKEEEQEAPTKKAQGEEEKPNLQQPSDEDASKQEDSTPPPLPPEVVLKVFMHCEGCAKKVRRILQGFPGVEDVITDCKTHKVVVKGEKADPVKVMERIQKKSHRKVELISPIPKPPPPAPEDDKKSSTNKADEKPKPEEPEKKKDEQPPAQPQVITVVLKVHMHCDACSLAIKKHILKMKGVESVETDLKSSHVTVVGVMDAKKLVDYLYKRTGKQAAVVKQDPPEKEEEEQENGVKSEGADNKKKELKKGANDKHKEGAGDKKGDGETLAGHKEDANKKDDKEERAQHVAEDEKMKLIELKQNEIYYYPAYYAPRFAMEQYNAAAAAHPPQLFSDENPNACSIM